MKRINIPISIFFKTQLSLMREIICIQIGQCGNQIGNKFWEKIGNEHGLDVHGISVPSRDSICLRQERLGVYYNETEGGKFVPRAILADLDPASIDSIKGGEQRKLFKTENMLNRGSGTGNSWAKGHYTEGVDLTNQVLEVARKEAESCDCLQGIQLSHSIGGGTGSGMGTLIASKLMEEQLASVIATFTHTPNVNVSDIVVEPYNAILSAHSLIECVDQTYMFDNNALNAICDRFLRLESANYEVMNHVVCDVMSGITSNWRFHGNPNNDLRKLGMSLIPFPRLSFLSIGFSPFTPPGTRGTKVVSVSELAQRLLDPHHYLTTWDPRYKRKHISMAAMFRGRVFIKELEEQISIMQADNREQFAQLFPTCVTPAVCCVTHNNLDLSSTYIANTTAIQVPLGSLLNQFDKLFRRKAYLHTYTSEGMDLIEFSEARFNVGDLISEYTYFDNTV